MDHRTSGLSCTKKIATITIPDNSSGTDKDQFFESMLEQRIKELEQELTELKQLELLNAQPGKAE